VLVTQAYRFELDANNKTSRMLAGHAGAARFAFNWGLATVIARLEARRAFTVLALRQGASAADAEVWAASLVGPVPWSLPALRREWNRVKDQLAPWWADYSKEAYSSGLDNLARALKGFFDSRSGVRDGSRMGWPRFKKRGRVRRSFRVTAGSFGVLDARHVRLPRIGIIRTKEATSELAARVESGNARILSATVSEQVGRWFVSFTCEVDRSVVPVPAGVAVGVDVGVKHLAVLSTGEKVANPEHLGRYQRRQARLQAELARRRGPGNGQSASRRWEQTDARMARTYRKAADARADSLHKLTTRLAKTHAVVVVEDLAVKNMTAAGSGRGRRGKAGLNRAILDVAPATLRRQLAYKTSWYGSYLIVANRWYPSSKTCSRCQTVKTKLSLRERIFRCDVCGLVIDRDLNAARNLASLVKAALINSGTASGAGTGQTSGLVNAQGDDKFMASARWSPTNCEDSTGQPGQTATAIEQSTAA
jgi:putative transposase